MERKSLLKSFSLVSLLLISSSATAQKNPFQEIKDFEQIFHRNYATSQFLSKTDNQHLIDNLSPSARKALTFHIDAKNRLIDELKDKEKEEGFLNYESLRNMTNVNYKRVGVDYINSSKVRMLNPRQFARVMLVFDGLKTKSFRDEIGVEIERDFLDAEVKQGYLPTEKGGVIRYEMGRVCLFPIASLDSLKPYSEEKARESNTKYKINRKILDETPNIGRYHLHVIEKDSTKRSGPSFNTAFINGVMIGDINAAKNVMENYGESHNFVITKLKDKSFNICYYGGEMDSNEDPQIYLINLGNYPYE